MLLLVTVLLPVIPLSFLVYDLVNRSYRIGVNEQVEQAIENGLFFSKEMYNRQRDQLAAALGPYVQSAAAPPDEPFPNMDTTYWNLLRFSYLNSQGEPYWQRVFTDGILPPIDRRILKQFQSPDQQQLVVSDRQGNRFTAVRKVGHGQHGQGFLVLEASLDSDFLQRADHTLRVHQMYQTLDLTRHSLLRSFLFAFIILALILLSLAVVVGIWISSRITAPLSLLVKGTTEIGQGNLKYRIPEQQRRDEIGQLVSHFNQMAGRLKENQERLIYLEKMALWQQIARKLAHEIKNPLTPIQLTVQQLVDKYDQRNPDYQNLLRECAEIINDEIGSLRRLVTTFSEFGRLPELHPERGNLNNLIREVSSLYGERIQLEAEHTLPDSVFDHDRMRRVMINLIENALQANPANQPVIIRTASLPGGIQVTVSDRGEGIAPEMLPRIFEPYFSTKQDGTGLGLAITRLIVEEHAGSIRVESKMGQGTTFTIFMTEKGVK